MDERHWWLVNKIQENFPVDPGSGCVEEFLSDPVRLDMLEQFFGEDGISRLFIWGNLQSVSSIQKSTLHLDVTLNELKAGQQMNASTTILYLFRPDTSQQVEILNIERDIYCGVLKGNAAENLQYLLQEVYIPLFKTQKDSRNADEQAVLMQQLRKSVNVLSLADQSSHSKPVVNKYQITISCVQWMRTIQEWTILTYFAGMLWFSLNKINLIWCICWQKPQNIYI